MKRPAFQFYPADWRKDMALQSCSVAARGLWIDMLCIAHECEPYGHLTVNGRAMTAAQIGRHTGLTEREAARLIDELDDAGVLSRNDKGVIFSRRMVRDEDLRNRRAAGGQAGAEHGAKGAPHGEKGGRPKLEEGGMRNPPSNDPRGDKKPLSYPPPSSSSSSSASALNTATSVEVAGTRRSTEALAPAGQLTLVGLQAGPKAGPYRPPDCPHQAVLELWAEVLPAMPQHRPGQWHKARADNLRARWRETAAPNRWPDQAAGLAHFRRLFTYCAKSPFLMGRTPPKDGRPPFAFELEWLVKPSNWARVIEGKYHNEAA